MQVLIPLLAALLVIGTSISNNTELGGVYLTLPAFGLFILATRQRWQASTPFKLGRLILAVCVLLTLVFQLEFSLEDASSRYGDVIFLLFAISLLRTRLKKTFLGGSWGNWFKQDQQLSNNLKVNLTASALTWPLSIGAVPVMIDALKEQVDDPKAAAALVMRTTTATTFIMPTTISAAVVYDLLPAFSLSELIWLSLPVLLLSTVVNLRIKILPRAAQVGEKSTNAKQQLFLLLLLFIGLCALLSTFFNTIQSIAISSLSLFGLMSFSSRGDTQGGLNEARESLSSVSPEILLIMCCGVLAVTVDAALQLEQFAFVLDLLQQQSGSALFMVLFVLPLLCLFGVHPLVAISVFYPLLHQHLPGGATEYLIWITMLVSAQLLSPISINAILASNSLGVSSPETSYRMHLGYAALMSTCGYLYIHFIL